MDTALFILDLAVIFVIVMCVVCYWGAPGE